MLQQVEFIPSPLPIKPAVGDSSIGVRASTTFDSAKNDRTMLATGRLQLSLLRFLEAEPCVQAFETLPDGAVDMRYWGGRVIVAALPSGGLERSAAFALRRRYAASGRRLVLIAERRLAAWPRRETCRLVAESGHAPISATERLIVLEAVEDAGGESCLGDLACLLPQRDDPVASILSLVPAGVLRIELDRPVSATSRISIFDPFRLPS